ncbi:MAG: class II aldolase [Gammaproteobacteria bacterium HGW-Gammaproteobacteria-4]|nr:MAG: class II aldolase [Gammaproteobacteria bacterium HGW-Gammaproteobacteria-4]
MSTLREALLQVSTRLAQAGLNPGTAGNVGVRDGDGVLITPSGMPVERITAHDMVWLGFDGRIQGVREPSSEWRLHHAILRTRPDIHAVIHTHSMFASTLSCLRRDVPPIHYMIAVTGARTIRCAPYALFGTQACADAAAEALLGSKACLLANHGMVALGRDLDDALAVALAVEELCEQYWRALQAGTPCVLSDAEMDAVFERFKSYGSTNNDTKTTARS